MTGRRDPAAGLSAPDSAGHSTFLDADPVHTAAADVTATSEVSEDTRLSEVTQVTDPREVTGLREATDPREAKDHWLDDVTEASSPIFSPATHFAFSTFAGPSRLLRRLWAFGTTTPGRLFAVTVLLTVAIAAAGISMSNSTASRQASLNHLLSVTEPTANFTHNLYSSLSLADTIASTGIVQGGVESDSNRQRYNEAIDRAAQSAAQALQGAEDARAQELIIFIQRQLPVYTGMVETARTNYRASNPVATAYMTNASSLMREQILPAAAELFAISSGNVSAEQRELTAPQWVPLSGLFAAVFFLLLAQWWLWKLTRRRLNGGFVAATSLLMVAVIWVSVANIAAWSAGAQGFEEAARPWSSLTNARIAGQQARTSETLALVLRESSDENYLPFDEVVASMRSALDDFEAANAVSNRANARETVKDARFELFNWSRTHSTFVAALRAGRYDDALYQATELNPRPGQPTTSAAAFNTLDQLLVKLIADSRETMRSYIANGLAAMTMLSTAVLLLTIAAIISVWIGIRPRLQEYL